MKLREIGNIVAELTNGKDILVDVNLSYFDYINVHGEECRISSMDIIDIINKIAAKKNDIIHTTVNPNGNIIVKSDNEDQKYTQMGAVNPIYSSIFEGYLAMYIRCYC